MAPHGKGLPKKIRNQIMRIHKDGRVPIIEDTIAVLVI